MNVTDLELGLLGDVGTLAWAQRADGLLTNGERRRFLAAAVAESARSMPRLLALKFDKAGNKRASITADDLLLPEVAPAASIIAECSRVMTTSVVEHSYRSYVYAKALGRLAEIGHDDLALFAAAMFHDTGAFQLDSIGEGRCFTLNSVRRLDELLKAAGWPDERRKVSAEAVVMHLNPRVGATRPEAHLLNAGVLLDVVGLRAWQFDAGSLETVRTKHPRLGFTDEARRLLTAQGKAVPRCRTAAAFRAGLGIGMRIGPWHD
ncbi:MAG: hypothetical protein ACXV3F_01630 [Frankiaceae bacterium]